MTKSTMQYLDIIAYEKEKKINAGKNEIVQCISKLYGSFRYHFVNGIYKELN